MANQYYDRYKSFRIDGEVKKIPFIEIDKQSTDLYITFDKSKMRLDTLSYKYYGDANYGWLLLLANPQFGSMEFEIPDNVVFRVPYPLQTAILRYENKVNEYFGKK
jgi:hypothetical protein